MSTRLGAAVLSGLAGLLLAAAGALSFLAGNEAEWHRLTGIGGYAIALGAVALIGYGLAPRAPVWLRLVVLVGAVLLAASVWQAVDQAIKDAGEGWRPSATSHLAAGALALLTAALAARADGRERAERGYQPSHR